MQSFLPFRHAPDDTRYRRARISGGGFDLLPELDTARRCQTAETGIDTIEQRRGILEFAARDQLRQLTQLRIHVRVD
jgi:hypothetical protein